MKTNYISSPKLGRDVPLSEVAEWIRGGMRLKDAAEKLGIARQRLSKRFHRDMGLTAQELQRQVKAQKTIPKPKPKPITIPHDSTIVLHLTQEQKQKVLSVYGSPEKLRAWIDSLPPGTKDPELVQRAVARNKGLTEVWNVKVTSEQLAKTRTIDRFRPKVREWIENQLN